MMEPFYSFEHADCTIELHYDEEPMSPAEWDNLGTLVISQALSRDWEPRGVETMEHDEEDAISRGGWPLLYSYLRLKYLGFPSRGTVSAAVPFYFADYGSSGSRLYAVDADADRIGGYIYTTAAREVEMFCDDFYPSTERVEASLRGELQTWSDYVEGVVAGYVVRHDGAVVGSCWSIYPDHEPIAPSEKATASYHVAWEELPDYLRGFANAVAEAVDEAEYEQAERERAASMDVATR